MRRDAMERGQNRTHSAGMGEEQSSAVGITVEARPAPPSPPRFSFYIDIFGYCNLRCPSCPVGNWEDDASVFHHGVMSRALLEAILDKAMAECTIAGVALFNWTEPLLHPAIHELIGVVRSRAIHCAISTNLNVLRDSDLLMRANPDWLRVSVSGFTQEVYARGHAAGDVEVVKTNMRRLAEAKARTGATTDLELYFHKYVDNEADEAPMRAYAEALGYRFASDWALMMPLEKTLTIADPANPRATLTRADHATIGRLALKTAEALAVTSKHKVTSCSLQEDFIVLDVNGNAILCCTCLASQANTIGSYLTMPIEAIQSARRSHPMCKPCMSVGFPLLANYAVDGLDDLAQRERAAFRRGTQPLAGLAPAGSAQMADRQL
jgi:pyruvate-formate lyase-activating enzyme